ncbi:MAG: nuclear transport factor 2 family protein [Steroidobacteraceae bacterium]
MNRFSTAILAALLSCTALPSHALDCKSTVTAADKVVALNEINNLMGRYSHLALLRGESTLEELFAMQTEGVFWKTATGPVGIAAMKAKFLKPGETAPALTPGRMFVHSMLTPVIEIAADGKTAQGVWDSWGPLVTDGDALGDWLWVKYGVDFIKENDQWKIWHLQVFPIFNTPYNKSITETAQAGGNNNGRPRQGQPGMGAAPGNAQASMQGPKDPLWIYDGKTAVRGPYVPAPYCSYDENKSSAQYADYSKYVAPLR